MRLRLIRLSPSAEAGEHFNLRTGSKVETEKRYGPQITPITQISFFGLLEFRWLEYELVAERFRLQQFDLAVLDDSA